ncbi:uncharacterized protein RJT20DRAFT_37280 [Scheffersomyces xylosifermentans]|uniref:uncharacterized protein n=1 Tax=Scheffersomyces xylosifermentans TaxID=1304137 RepID=UPI00315CBF82
MAKNKKKSNSPKVVDTSVPKPEQDTDEIVDLETAVDTEETENGAPTNGSIVEGKDTEADNDGESIKIAELQKKIEQLTLEVEKKDKIISENASKSNGKVEEEESNNVDYSKTQELIEQLASTQKERDEIKSSYDALLSRMATVKSIFSKMKEAESALEESQKSLDQFKEENAILKHKLQETEKSANAKASSSEQNDALIKKLTEQNEDLNNECDRLSDALTKSRREYQVQLEELQDEKYSLENQNSKLSKKINELKVEITEFNLIKDELAMENKNSLLKIEELNDKNSSKDVEIVQLRASIEKISKAVEERQVQFGTKETNYKQQIGLLEEEIALAKQDIASKLEELTSTQEQLAKLQEEAKQIDQLKLDINNKQLIIGKLRHEAIILNEHLTKSLTMLKQHGGEGNKAIDKELISNVIVSFLQFPRGDTKKFEALQLISALLEWDESQRIAAGLSHSTQVNRADDDSKSGRQSFVNLWTDFLEKESSSTK